MALAEGSSNSIKLQMERNKNSVISALKKKNYSLAIFKINQLAVLKDILRGATDDVVQGALQACLVELKEHLSEIEAVQNEKLRSCLEEKSPLSGKELERYNKRCDECMADYVRYQVLLKGDLGKQLETMGFCCDSFLEFAGKMREELVGGLKEVLAGGDMGALDFGLRKLKRLERELLLGINEHEFSYKELCDELSRNIKQELKQDNYESVVKKISQLEVFEEVFEHPENKAAVQACLVDLGRHLSGIATARINELKECLEEEGSLSGEKLEQYNKKCSECVLNYAQCMENQSIVREGLSEQQLKAMDFDCDYLLKCARTEVDKLVDRLKKAREGHDDGVRSFDIDRLRLLEDKLLKGDKPQWIALSGYGEQIKRLVEEFRRGSKSLEEVLKFGSESSCTERNEAGPSSATGPSSRLSMPDCLEKTLARLLHFLEFVERNVMDEDGEEGVVPLWILRRALSRRQRGCC